MGAEAEMGMERVGGRLSPGKDVRSTLIVRGAMARSWMMRNWESGSTLQLRSSKAKERVRLIKGR